MNYFELLENRYSVRKFTNQSIPREILEKIILSANAAPVGSNLYKDVHLTLIQNRDIMEHLSEAARFRRKDKATMQAITAHVPQQANPKEWGDPFYGAPAAIIVSHRRQTLQPGIEYSNVASIVQTMHLAAIELGLGSVYLWGVLEAMRIYPQFDHTDLLNLPDDFEPLLGIAIGYPAQDRPPRTLNPEKITINYL